MSSDPATSKSRDSKWWIRWFPLLWSALLAVLYGLIQYWLANGMDTDKGVVATIAILNLAWMGLLVWLLFCWPPIVRLSIAQKWLLRAAVAAVVIAVFASIDVDYDGDSRWRAIRFAWNADPDEQLEALEASNVANGWQTSPDDYPRFLGSGYWAEVSDVMIDDDWEARPPELLWKQPIGAGWSAFAVVGDYAITQEQRGAQELVVCYRAIDGDVVWTHADNARHDPTDLGGGLGGIGPRATPTVHNGRVYTMGATGIVNCLDAQTGEPIWSHNIPEEYAVTPLLWANAGSPLVVPDTNLVVVNGGQANDADGHSLFAFDRDTGALVWQAGPQVTSYASPVYAVFAEVPQIIQVNESTVSGHRVDDGQELWMFEQPGSSSGNASCSQPIPLADDRVLVSKGYGIGAKLVQVDGADTMKFGAEQIWAKNVLKTKLANLVVRNGYAYGLDHTLMSCVDVETGKRKWKKRRSGGLGHGQVLLVGDKIFVLSETGEGVLLECNPDKYVELASMQLLTEDGVTWNNPVIAGPLLLVRNNLEAACYRLPLLSQSPDEAGAGP